MLTFEDLIGSDDSTHPIYKAKAMVVEGNIPDLLLVGPPGTGKTSTALAIGQALDADVYEFNASDERGIDFIRTRVKQVATQRGYSDITIILLDEADGLTRQAQDALRRTIEKGHALFILTANEEANIIPALRSRCHTLHFAPYGTTHVHAFLQKNFKHLCKSSYGWNGYNIKKIGMAFNGDLRSLGIAAQTVQDARELENMATIKAEMLSAPALSIAGGDWKSLREELYSLNQPGRNMLTILNMLHDRVRDLDMEPERFHHYSQVWGDAVLSTHQWPLDNRGFIDWFVGSLSLPNRREEKNMRRENE
ncbi:uncharacterized protein METZ01_LOCUS339890 [marine metagenome]|uniref:AAA+ ATPase domain-containing protein n=1 Tax=marine metagenome TaxID=408172 RepID=A0A382QNL4_9ZZZZ